MIIMREIETPENEAPEILPEEEWDELIRNQIKEMSCDYREFHSFTGNNFQGMVEEEMGWILPVIAYDDERCPYPLVVGLVVPLKCGYSRHFHLSKDELPIPMADLMLEILQAEGFTRFRGTDEFYTSEVFLDANIALLLTEEDHQFAQEFGWFELMHQVRTGRRSNHRLAFNHMGDYMTNVMRSARILRKRIRRQSGEDPGFIPYGEINEHQEQFDENEQTDDEFDDSED